MRLLTEVVDGYISFRRRAIDARGTTPTDVVADLTHDTRYAHALVAAMCVLSPEKQQTIRLTADLVMREWGAK